MKHSSFRKIIVATMIVLAALSFGFAATACNKDKAPVCVEIRIAAQPTVRQYTVGDAFVSDGLKVEAVYDTGDAQDVTSEISLSTPDMTSTGTKTVTVTWKTFETTFTIVVSEPQVQSLEIVSEPQEKTVLRTEEPDLDGLVVKAHYANNTEEVVTDYTMMPVDTTTIGEKTVTIYFGGQSASFTVTVINNPACPQIMFDTLSDDESKFLYEDFGSQAGETDDHLYDYRFADGFAQKPGADIKGNYWIYCINAQAPVKDATLILTLGGNYRVGISYDGSEWTEIARYEGTDDYNRSPVTYTFDLSEKTDLTQNDGLIYVRFYSAEDKGFGCYLIDFRLDYTFVDGAQYAEPSGSPYLANLSFAADGVEDAAYITDAAGTVETFNDPVGWRFNLENGTTYRVTGSALGSDMIYCIDVGAKMSAARLSFTVAGGHKVSVSSDRETWAEVDAVMWTQATEADACVQTTAVDLKKSWSAFADNTGKLYVKIESNHDGNGWSGAILVDLKLDYTLVGVDADSYPDPKGDDGPGTVVYADTLTFAADGESDAQYLTQDGASHPEEQNQDWSLNIPKGTTYRTCGNQATDYFVYCIDLGKKAEFAKISYVIAANYAVSISFDGTEYIEVAREADNEESKACQTTLTHELHTLSGFENNTGKIYIKFASTGTYWAAVRVMSVTLEYTTLAE